MANDSYTVIKQAQTIGRLPDDTFGPVVRVTFRTANGTVRSIDVDANAYNVDNVREAIEAEVQKIEDVANL